MKLTVALSLDDDDLLDIVSLKQADDIECLGSIVTTKYFLYTPGFSESPLLVPFFFGAQIG